MVTWFFLLLVSIVISEIGFFQYSHQYPPWIFESTDGWVKFHSNDCKYFKYTYYPQKFPNLNVSNISCNNDHWKPEFGYTKWQYTDNYCDDCDITKYNVSSYLLELIHFNQPCKRYIGSTTTPLTDIVSYSNNGPFSPSYEQLGSISIDTEMTLSFDIMVNNFPYYNNEQYHILFVGNDYNDAMPEIFLYGTDGIFFDMSNKFDISDNCFPVSTGWKSQTVNETGVTYSIMMYYNTEGTVEIYINNILELSCSNIGTYSRIANWTAGLTLRATQDKDNWNKYQGEVIDIGEDKFNELFQNSQHHIIRRECSSCDYEAQDIYYRRISDDGNTFKPYNYLKHWTDTNNIFGHNFALYSSLSDAINDYNRWDYCEFDYNQGAFGECGKYGKSDRQWAADAYSGVTWSATARFSIYKADVNDKKEIWSAPVEINNFLADAIITNLKIATGDYRNGGWPLTTNSTINSTTITADYCYVYSIITLEPATRDELQMIELENDLIKQQFPNINSTKITYNVYSNGVRLGSVFDEWDNSMEINQTGRKLMPSDCYLSGVSTPYDNSDTTWNAYVICEIESVLNSSEYTMFFPIQSEQIDHLICLST
eukprot:7417_1